MPPSTAADMVDQNGLRGLLSIYIVVFHCLIYDFFPIDLQGSSFMPLFFLLSGFSLTIGYYHKIVDQTIISSSDGSNLHSTAININSDNRGKVYSELENNHNASSDLVEPFHPSSNAQRNESRPQTLSWTSFMRNRLIRTLPVYWICFLLCLPTFYAGFTELSPTDIGYFNISIITNVLPVSSWFGFFFGQMLDGPAWTISTLCGMWMFFPMLVRHLSKYSDHGLLKTIKYLYISQLVLLFLIFYGSSPFVGFWSAFSFATWNPLSRLPVFAMGICAAILCIRYPGENMIWFTNSTSYFPCHCSCLAGGQEEFSNHSPQDFQRSLKYQALIISGITFAVTAADAAVRYTAGSSIQGAVWLQAVNPFCQLMFIVALARHRNPDQSFVSKFFRSSFMQWLGNLSMSIYLVHYVIIYYILWWRYGKSKLTWPTVWDCSAEYDDQDASFSNCKHTLNTFQYYKTWPNWSFVVLPILSTIFAFVFYNAVEKPINNYFKK